MNTVKTYFIAAAETVKSFAVANFARHTWRGLLIFVFLTAGSNILLAQAETGNNSQSSSVQSPISPASKAKSNALPEKIQMTDQHWRLLLTDEEYYVTRQKGTERAYSGKLWDNKQDGIYTCKCCRQPLFDAKAKFESGTGWPSYFQPISPRAVSNIQDFSAGMARTEVVCSRCDSHLGHVFDDGPKPTGLRYCMNSVSLSFLPRKNDDAKDAGVQANPAVVSGYESAQKLVEALSLAMAKNSFDKFIQCHCWERLSDLKKSKLKNAKIQLPTDVVSMSLEPGIPKLSDDLEFNIKVMGGIEIRFADASKNFAIPYGTYRERFYLATPVQKGSWNSDAAKK